MTAKRDWQRSRVYAWENRVIAAHDPSFVSFSAAQGMVNAIWSEMGLSYPPKVESLPKHAKATVATATRLCIRLPNRLPSWCLLHEMPLAAEASRNLEAMWLLRGLRPDFRTIADFRRDNRDAFKAVFRAFVALCRRLDLFGRELLAVDGTRLKAVNSRRRNFTREKLAEWIRQVDERIEKYLSCLDRADEAESDGATLRAAALAAKIVKMRERRQALEAMLAELVASGESQISLTDPDARGMATHPKVGVG